MMSSKFILRLFFVIAAVALLAAPTFVRAVVWGYNLRPYGVGQVPVTSVAATPMPTNTPIPVVADSMLLDRPLRPGPVVVDLAHGNVLTRSQFEPLAAALARRGVGLRPVIERVVTTTPLAFPGAGFNELATLGIGHVAEAADPRRQQAGHDLVQLDRCGHVRLGGDHRGTRKYRQRQTCRKRTIPCVS